MMPNPTPMPVEAPSVMGQLAAFVVIGAAGAAGFVALSSLASLVTGSESSLVNALCYAALIGPVYLAHRRFSFQSELPHSHALPRYIGVQLMAVALVTLFSYLVYSILGMTSVVAATLVIALTSGLNFVVLRGWAFAQQAPVALFQLRPIAHE
jgi:putative flippase GtrA